MWVFCGSSTGTHPSFAAAAVALGTMLAERNIELVYGGASVGLMGVVADAAFGGGWSGHRRDHGVIVPITRSPTAAWPVSTWSAPCMSGTRMAELSDAFVMLPRWLRYLRGIHGGRHMAASSPSMRSRAESSTWRWILRRSSWPLWRTPSRWDSSGPHNACPDRSLQ